MFAPNENLWLPGLTPEGRPRTHVSLPGYWAKTAPEHARGGKGEAYFEDLCRHAHRDLGNTAVVVMDQIENATGKVVSRHITHNIETDLMLNRMLATYFGSNGDASAATHFTASTGTFLGQYLAIDSNTAYGTLTGTTAAASAVTSFTATVAAGYQGNTGIGTNNNAALLFAAGVPTNSTNCTGNNGTGQYAFISPSTQIAGSTLQAITNLTPSTTTVPISATWQIKAVAAATWAVTKILNGVTSTAATQTTSGVDSASVGVPGFVVNNGLSGMTAGDGIQFTTYAPGAYPGGDPTYGCGIVVSVGTANAELFCGTTAGAGATIPVARTASTLFAHNTNDYAVAGPASKDNPATNTGVQFSSGQTAAYTTGSGAGNRKAVIGSYTFSTTGTPACAAGTYSGLWVVTANTWASNIGYAHVSNLPQVVSASFSIAATYTALF